jgi:hypothetical protein
MPATYPDRVRRDGALDQQKIDALLTTYREALNELRSWKDPRVADLIVRLESLQRLVGRRARLN